MIVITVMNTQKYKNTKVLGDFSIDLITLCNPLMLKFMYVLSLSTNDSETEKPPISQIDGFLLI